MPMPILDPDTYVDAWLSDPAHKLPLPDKGGRLFFVAGEKVNRHEQFYAALIADGSLVIKEPEWVAAAAEAAAVEAAAVADAKPAAVEAAAPEMPATAS